MPFFSTKEISFTHLSAATINACAEIAQTAPDPWRKEDLQNALQDENQWCLVALLGAAPVAFASFLTLLDTADLRLLAVHPSQRNKGIGTYLLRECLQKLAQQNIENCLLEVRESNQNAIHLYQTIGFKTLAKRKNLYSSPTENGFLMAVSTSAFL